LQRKHGGSVGRAVGRVVCLTELSWLSMPPQEITTRDETGAPCTRGMRTTPFGQYVADGPPTGLSGEASSRQLPARRRVACQPPLPPHTHWSCCLWHPTQTMLAVAFPAASLSHPQTGAWTACCRPRAPSPATRPTSSTARRSARGTSSR
jgi:hypothetical protein